MYVINLWGLLANHLLVFNKVIVIQGLQKILWDTDIAVEKELYFSDS